MSRRMAREDGRTGLNDSEGSAAGVSGLNSVVRFEVFTAGTMKNAVFWDTETQFVPHGRNISSPLERPLG
jgi:hypothetical protein